MSESFDFQVRGFLVWFMYHYGLHTIEIDEMSMFKVLNMKDVEIVVSRQNWDGKYILTIPQFKHLKPRLQIEAKPEAVDVEVIEDGRE